MTVGLLSTIATMFLMVTYFVSAGLCSPLVNLIIDTTFLVLYLTALGSFAAQFYAYLNLPTCIDYYGDIYPFCGSVKGNMAMIALLLYAISLFRTSICST